MEGTGSEGTGREPVQGLVVRGYNLNALHGSVMTNKAYGRIYLESERSVRVA